MPIDGPTQYRELAEAGELPPPRAAVDVGGVNVTQALAQAGGDVPGGELTDDERAAVIALIRGESDDLDGVKKDHLEAFVDVYNLHAAEDGREPLSKNGNKAQLLETLRGAVNS